MEITYAVKQLDSDTAWDELAEVLGGVHLEVVNGIVRHLRGLGVKSYLLEHPYIDRDYSADYRQFYSSTFRVYGRHCKRVHFFSSSIAPHQNTSESMDEWLGRLRGFRNTYCGFCVIRPLPKAPIGRTILRGNVRNRKNTETIVTCRAEYDANIFGVDFRVTGAPFLQQDSRVGACAQVAIWAGMRHMHARHNYNWLSVADINKLASPTTSVEGMSIPAGSEFLTSERMIRAINEAGYQPLCFYPGITGDISSTILPYVESGIPVILGLRHRSESRGHAVTVVGRVFVKQNGNPSSAIDYIAAYIVQDDQRGPYYWLPMNKMAANTYSTTAEDDVVCGTNNFTVADATFAVALMSPRVFSTAASAQVSARDRIDQTLTDMPEIRRTLLQRGVSVNEHLLDELQSARNEDRIVLRTYLTSTAGYRRYISDGMSCADLKQKLLRLHLPHFTWITEISTVSSYNHTSSGKRRIYGHTIFDATSTSIERDGLLMLHLPSLLFTKDVNAPPDERETLSIIHSDRPYNCREKRR